MSARNRVFLIWPFAIVPLAIVAWSIHKDFGMAWDDGIQAEYGARCLDFYLSLGSDKSFLDLFNMANYGALFETASAAIHNLLGLTDIYSIRGFLCAVTAIICAHLTVRIAKEIGLASVSWFAGILLITSPQFWGQAFVNSKDVPFAAAYCLLWLCYIRWVKSDFSDKKWMWFTIAGASLLIALRISGLPLILIVFCSGLFWWILQEQPLTENIMKRIRRFPWGKHFQVVFFSYLLMLPTWPYSLVNPLVHPLEAFVLFLDFPYKVFVTIAGSTYTSDSLPRFAFSLEHFLANPLYLYPFYLAGIISILIGLNRKSKSSWLPEIVMAVWLVPIFVIFLVQPFSMYHGVRQTLFIWPGYSLLGANGYLFLHRAIINRGLNTTLLHIFACAILLANVLVVISWHPFSYTYRNSLVGIFPNGINGFDTDYHALSYKLAAEWIDRLAIERIELGQPPPSVAILADRFSTMGYLRYQIIPKPTAFTFEARPDPFWKEVELILMLNPFQKEQRFIEDFGLDARKVVHRIQNNGQLYAEIYQATQ